MSLNPRLASGLLALVVTACGGSPRTDLTGTLIVLNKAEASASLLDAASGSELYKLPTGAGPHEVAVSPDGRTAIVANYGQRGRPGHTLTVIGLPEGRVTDTIDLKEYHRPHGIEFLPDGERVIVTVEQEQAVVVVDVARGEVTQAIRTDQDVSHMLVLSPTADRVYVANIGSGTVTAIDLIAGEVLATIETGAGAEGIAMAPDGAEVWVSNRAADTLSIIDTETLEVVASLPCASFPIRVSFTIDGRHVLVSNARSGDVAVFDTGARREVRRIAMKVGPLESRDGRLFQSTFEGSPVPVGILVSTHRRHAYVTNTNADVVTLLDLDTWSVAGRLKAGKEPDGMAYSAVAVRGSPVE